MTSDRILILFSLLGCEPNLKLNLFLLFFAAFDDAFAEFQRLK